jgi:spore maturation protein SpmB
VKSKPLRYLASTLQGSVETTFYMLAVYLGAVQVRRIRQTLAAALTADLSAVIAAVALCAYLFTNLPSERLIHRF